MSGQHEDFIPNTPKELLQQYSKAIVHKLKEVAPYLIKSYSLNNPLQEKTSNKLVKLSKLHLSSPKQWIQSLNIKLMFEQETQRFLKQD